MTGEATTNPPTFAASTTSDVGMAQATHAIRTLATHRGPAGQPVDALDAGRWHRYSTSCGGTTGQEETMRARADGWRGSATVTVIGCGDAFGSGGRMHTCFHVESSIRFLLDCGASALIGLKREGIDPHAIDAIVLTHMHGDHFAGIPFLIRETQIAGGRTKPLTILGPPGHEQRIRATMDLLFPGSAGGEAFGLRFVEYVAGERSSAAGLSVLAVEARHTIGTAAHAVRVEWAGLAVAYSGDTEWVPTLPRIADGADLFICECYRTEPGTPNHLDYRTLMAYRQELRCGRLLLTHMDDGMIALEEAGLPERARDGLRLTLGEDPHFTTGGAT